MNLLTVKTFDDGISAHILKTRLESDGIACYIHDENIVTLNPLYSFAVGGVKLKVDQPDLDKALKILKEIEDKPYTDENQEIIECPNCGSTDLYSNFKSMKDPAGVFAAITSFLLTVFPIYFKSVYRCKKCEKEFEVK